MRPLPGNSPNRTLAVRSDVDVTACDVEPIHIPGSIQPHGLLLIVDLTFFEIVAGAGDIAGRLMPDWLGKPLDFVLGEGVASQLKKIVDSEGDALALDHVRGRSEIFDVIPHISGPHISSAVLMVELEPIADHIPSAITVLTALDAASSNFAAAPDFRSMCERAAKTFRLLTRYDRVMVYRFLEDGAGVVEAEDNAPELGSFLNHHFPASDIPKQARALYVRNRIRVIPDVDYIPQPIGPDEKWRSIDLSDIGLRSVSPIHIQYLKNMGVGASASISIVKDGVLWGLIACHNQTPKRISYDVRVACLELAGGLSRQITAKEDADSHRERGRLRSSEDAIVALLGGEISFAEFFASAGDHLCRMLNADGFAAIQRNELYRAGKCPADDVVRELGEWVSDRAIAQPFSTHSLGRRFHLFAPHEDVASGFLAITMSVEEPTILMWFRAEHREKVNWAGNPHKAVDVVPGAVLNPRSSFEAWSESVRGHAKPWSRQEIEAANRLRRVLFDARQNRRLRELNREFAATVADKETLLRQKDFLMKEVNHRVQNSLQIVSSFLGLQARSASDPTLTEHLGEAQRRLSAVALVHRRLYSDDQVQAIDLARYLEDLCTDMKTSMGADWRDQFTVSVAAILISTDRAVSVGLIATELVINATKYAHAGGTGPISVTLEQQGDNFRLTVTDRGSGKAKAQQGFGTRLLKALVDQLSGKFEERDAQPGLQVIVIAPIQNISATGNH